MLRKGPGENLEMRESRGCVGEEHSRQREEQHAKALSQKPAGGDLSKTIEGQEGTEASGIGPAFFKVILITVRIQGGQEWEPRDQVPGSFHRGVLIESLKQRQAHFNRYLLVDSVGLSACS